MEVMIPDTMETGEMQLLIDLYSYNKPFLLNEAFEQFNHEKLSKLRFYTVFFGLQVLRLVRVENLPSDMVNGSTNITYVLTQYGKDIVALFKSKNEDFFDLKAS